MFREISERNSVGQKSFSVLSGSIGDGLPVLPNRIETEHRDEAAAVLTRTGTTPD